MPFRFWSRSGVYVLAAFLWLSLSAGRSAAQPSGIDFGAAAGDAVKLFQLGQDFQERKQLLQALSCYQEALKLRPDFPEAEYQKAAVLVGLGRPVEAEVPLRHALALVPEWPLPHAALGALLLQLKRLPEAAEALAKALALDDKNPIALNTLVELRLLAPDARETLPPVLLLLQKATEGGPAPVSLWLSRSAVEHALGRPPEALNSLTRALAINPRSLPALQQRAELLAEMGRLDDALNDARAFHSASAQGLSATLMLARLYLLSGRKEEARQTLDVLRENERRQPEAVTLYNSLLLSGPADAAGCAALEKLAPQQSGNAAVLARLGACTRLTNPAQALEYYRRAVELEPRNVDYATGYAASLVQARRFPEAVVILRRILAVMPEHATAHANLATALFEAKDYAAALEEFRWLAARQPENAVTYYFIGIAQDKLTYFPEALAAYEKFLALAHADVHKLEIEKVNLRLPSLRNQIKNGAGIKNKKRA